MSASERSLEIGDTSRARSLGVFVTRQRSQLVVLVTHQLAVQLGLEVVQHRVHPLD